MVDLDMVLRAAARLDGLGVGARVYVRGGVFMRSLLSGAGLFMRPFRHTTHSRSSLHKRGRGERVTIMQGTVSQIFNILLPEKKGNFYIHV
jgi:hypothetical protein